MPMRSPSRSLSRAAALLALLGAACAENASAPEPAETDLSTAFQSAPVGFENATSSFSASGGDTGGYRPGSHASHHSAPGMMGGGLHHDFLGALARPFEHHGFAGACSYSAATGLVTCTATLGGLTFLRTYAFRTASGQAQARFDSTTHSVATHTEVSGTVTRRDSVTATVRHVSDRRVTGTEKGSTRRTVEGASAGTENLAGRDSAGVAFTANRSIGDTIVGLVVPIQDGRPTYPSAGTVTRVMRVTLTRAGHTVTRSRREVITFNGTSTATLVITIDGRTRTCSLPLPHGRPVCS